MSRTPIRSTPPSRNEIRDQFDVNVHGVINVTLACRDSMRERGGGVVLNMSSRAGYMSACELAPADKFSHGTSQAAWLGRIGR